MADLVTEENLRAFDAQSEKLRKKISSLQDYSISELLSLRAEIDARLPASSLQDMNLERELVRQYLKVQELQEESRQDEGVPYNQQAQVANSVASTLDALVKMQKDIYTSERFKAIENLLIQYIKRMPLELAEQFVAEYEALA